MEEGLEATKNASVFGGGGDDGASGCGGYEVWIVDSRYS